MFVIFPKKYRFFVHCSEERFKQKCSEKVPKLNFNELRKDWLMTPVFYGTLKDRKMTVHHHAARKRDLDSVYFSGIIKPSVNGISVEGRFQRSTKNTVMAIAILILWVIITVCCFTQNIIAGFVCVALTILCFWLFFWDEGKIDIIKSYLDSFIDEITNDRS